MIELRNLALQAFEAHDPLEKYRLIQSWREHPHDHALDTQIALNSTLDRPGCPERPVLVDPERVPRRSPHTLAGRAALMHAIAHIEFNAIALALDAVWRFPGMPTPYYLQWMQIAAEEADHFGLVRDQLQRMGSDYGAHEAHDGLWEMCHKTRHDLVARMALVPRTLEARGLDATPIIQAKLRQVGTADALACVDILDIILRDEIGHVAVGNHWFRWLCEREGLEPMAHYATLQKQYQAPWPKPPLNEAARAQAGFSAEEMALFSQACAPQSA